MVKKVSINNAYKQWAKRYDSDLPYLFESESEKVIPLLGKVKGKSILDLGCGTGRYSIALAKMGAIVTAVDFSKEMISVAKKKAKKEGVKIQFMQVDLKKQFPFSKEEFDFVLCMLVLGHFKSPSTVMGKISKTLKLNGVCIISTFHPQKGKPKSGEFILVPSLGLDARKYKQSINEYKDSIMDNGLSLDKFLEIQFSRKMVSKAKKDGVDLEPYSHSPFLIVFKADK